MSFALGSKTNPCNDTLIELIANAFGKCLSREDIIRMQPNPAKWFDDIHPKVLLSLYSHMIGVEKIPVAIVNDKLIEPITLYRGPKNKLIHCVSIDYCKTLFQLEPMFRVENAKQVLMTFNYPEILTVGDSNQVGYSKYVLSRPLTVKMLVLYNIANHAAYHYALFKQYKTLDYTHSNMRDISKEFFLHQLITPTKDYKIANYVKEPKASTFNKDVDVSNNLIRSYFVYGDGTKILNNEKDASDNDNSDEEHDDLYEDDDTDEDYNENDDQNKLPSIMW
jgi:hypothetical protein